MHIHRNCSGRLRDLLGWGGGLTGRDSGGTDTVGIDRRNSHVVGVSRDQASDSVGRPVASYSAGVVVLRCLTRIGIHQLVAITAQCVVSIEHFSEDCSLGGEQQGVVHDDGGLVADVLAELHRPEEAGVRDRGDLLQHCGAGH